MAYETSPVPLQVRAGDLLDRVGLVERAFTLESKTGNPLEINLNEAPIPVGEAYLVAAESRQAPPVGDDAVALLKQDLLASAHSLFQRGIIGELPNDSLTIAQLQNLIITHAPTYKEPELLTYRQALIEDLRRKGILSLDYVDDPEEMPLWMLDDLASSRPDGPETPLQEAERASSESFENLRAERLKLAQQLQEQGIIPADYKLDTFDLTYLDAVISSSLKTANLPPSTMPEEIVVERDRGLLQKAKELYDEINEGVRILNEPVTPEGRVSKYYALLDELTSEEAQEHNIRERLDRVWADPLGKAAVVNFIFESGVTIVAFLPAKFPLGRIIVPVARALLETKEFSRLLRGGEKAPLDNITRSTMIAIFNGSKDQGLGEAIFSRATAEELTEIVKENATSLCEALVNAASEKLGLHQTEPQSTTYIIPAEPAAPESSGEEKSLDAAEEVVPIAESVSAVDDEIALARRLLGLEVEPSISVPSEPAVATSAPTSHVLSESIATALPTVEEPKVDEEAARTALLHNLQQGALNELNPFERERLNDPRFVPVLHEIMNQMDQILESPEYRKDPQTALDEVVRNLFEQQSIILGRVERRFIVHFFSKVFNDYRYVKEGVIVPEMRLTLEQAMHDRSLLDVMKTDFADGRRSFPLVLEGAMVTPGLQSLFGPMIRSIFKTDPNQPITFVCSFERPNVLVIELNVPKEKAGEFITGAIRITDEKGIVSTTKARDFKGLSIGDNFKLNMGIGGLMPRVLEKANEAFKGSLVLTGVHLKDQTLIVDGYPVNELNKGI